MIKHSRKPSKSRYGLPPGALIHVGERKIEEVEISFIDYDGQTINEERIEHIQETARFRETHTVSWININGLHEIGVLENIGKIFDIHSLVLEDILNTQQRPKIESYEGYLHMVLKMLDYNVDSMEIVSEQVSVILKNNLLLSFQERPGDVLDPIRERLKKGLGKLRKSGADYLAYAIVDAIVDRYFYILEMLGERIEVLEEALLADPSKDSVKEIYTLKRQLITLRHAVWPLREAVNSLRKGESELVQEGTLIFFGDLHDHIIQVIDTVENYREMVAGLLDLYLSSVSNRMNEVMKVLTVIATFFIPLTFIAGIYGMNFEFMPELGWKWSYPVLWVIMIIIAGFMASWFRKKKWL